MRSQIRFIGLSLVLAASVFFACDDDASGPGNVLKETPLKYDIGNTGPAGGIIFYINPDAATDGWKYLECAPKSTEFTSKQWGLYGTYLNTTYRGIGQGKLNTQKLVSELNKAGESNRAAQLCDALVYGGYDDWFLPSEDELYQIWWNLVSDQNTNANGGNGNRRADALGDFDNAKFYWSSYESNSDWAWGLYFDGSDPDSGVKNIEDLVRAIRMF